VRALSFLLVRAFNVFSALRPPFGFATEAGADLFIASAPPLSKSNPTECSETGLSEKGMRIRPGLDELHFLRLIC